MNQLELHKKIEEFFKVGIKLANVKVAQDLLKNDDAKRFFFSLADVSWLNWLWDKGLLDKIKEKSEDPTNIVYRLPELDYLVRIAKENPAMVTEIIFDKSTATNEENFNPEVIHRFLWIISNFSAEQIKILTPKILGENWLYLMRAFRKSGYEFERIIKELIEKKEGGALLELAQAMLVVKSKEEIKNKEIGFNTDDPFCVDDLDASGIFQALADIEKPYAEQALKITTNIMAEIVKLSGKDETEVFEYTDFFSLYDVDFFTLEIEDTKSYSFREDIKNLAATIKKIVEKLIGGNCGNTEEARKFFTYIDNLPSCRSMWRLKLFALSQCPEVFKLELRNAFFKVFDVGERYFEIEGGAEYHQALIQGFGVLNKETEQREYIQKVFEYFGAKLGDKDKEKWRKRDGLETLSCIKEYLTLEEKEEAKKVFGYSLDEVKFTPEPSIGKMKSGIVSHRSPVNLSEYTIEQIIANLKSEWTPKTLSEKYKDDDFLNRTGVEGLGDALKEDVKKRTDDYIKYINSFFNRKEIHSHYTYSLLRGIEEILRNKQTLNLGQIASIFSLFEIIRSNGREIPFKRKKDDSWLVDWIEVHKVIIDILLLILENKELKAEIHKTYKEQIEDLISYLFTIKDSPSKEDEKPEYGEPYHIAINSVRGRAYEAFTVFTENDGETLSKNIQKLYREALEDKSLAVRFVIGRYLATFYFRDKDFITTLLPEIFPKDDSEKKDIYLASWEGYLSNTLYDKMFVALKDYYSHAITLEPKIYTERKYSKGLDESLAIHLALAFAHLGLEITDPLFTQFWSTPNETRHYEFVSFIGRSCLTRDQAGDEWLEKNKVSKEKLITFWDWLLEKDFEPKTYSGFGFWINQNKEVLSDKDIIKRLPKTLEKSKGNLDWDYGFTRRLEKFAELNPENTLKCIELYLLTLEGTLNPHRGVPMFSIDKEIKDALIVCYKNPEIRKDIENLINKLITVGSSIFWGLKDVIQ